MEKPPCAKFGTRLAQRGGKVEQPWDEGLIDTGGAERQVAANMASRPRSSPREQLFTSTSGMDSNSKPRVIIELPVSTDTYSGPIG